MLEAKFCLLCGERLIERQFKERLRMACPHCGYVHYVNPVVAAGAFVIDDGRVVLVRRGVVPRLGLWAFPAGYAEVDETPAEAAIRETREETGLCIAVDHLLGVYPFAGPPSGVLVLYVAHIVGGAMRAGDDALEVRQFEVTELPAENEIAFAAHRRVLATWARGAHPPAEQ